MGGLDEASPDEHQQNVGNGVVAAMPSVKVTIVPILLKELKSKENQHPRSAKKQGWSNLEIWNKVGCT